MGWAKYYADNMEIMQERLETMCSYSIKADISVACKTPVSIFPSIIIQVVPQVVVLPAEKKDKVIVCKDCGRKLCFSAKSQAFYEKQGWETPKRCKECRELRKVRFLMCSSY